jgi:glycosyltransferase 2 family protein
VKKALLNALKVAVPLGVGFWLAYTQYSALNEQQRSELFAAFGQADLKWLWLASAVGWLAHVSRGWRWRYLLEPLGHRPGFWSCYHGVMIGYFVGMFIPRGGGEASRAASLYRSEKVPFDQGFGTVMAERVVDVAMLLLIAAAAVVFQYDKLDLFQARIAQFRMSQGRGPETGSGWGWWVLAAVVLVGCAGVYLVLTRPTVRARLMDLLRGFGEGLRTVFHTKNKALFLLHTVLIWVAYIAMFQVGFYCLPSMVEVPFAGILAGFIAGAIGIALVQGGIGVYPAFVALMVGVYMAAPAEGSLLRPDALAMGWLLWVAQTLMIIVLGGLSLLLAALKKTTV